MALKQIQGTFVPDNSESDHGYEALLDFEMSWVLRVCANQDEARFRPYLYHQCRKILKELTGIGINKCVEEVKVWKQWKYIDVLAEIRVKDEGLHILVLEDKAYTGMSEKQRDVYPRIVFDYYANQKVYSYHFCVIAFWDSDTDENKAKMKALKSFAEESSSGFEDNQNCRWQVFSTSDLPDWAVNNYTESDLFNEFWFAKW